MPIMLCQGEGHIERTVIGKVRTNTAESENLCMRGHSKRENREVRWVSNGNEKRGISPAERSANVSDGKADMNANRPS